MRLQTPGTIALLMVAAVAVSAQRSTSAIVGMHRLLNPEGQDVGQLAVWDAARTRVAGQPIPNTRLFAWVETCLQRGEPAARRETSGMVIERSAGRYDLVVDGRTVMTVDWRSSGSTWSAAGAQGTVVTGGEIALAPCS